MTRRHAALLASLFAATALTAQDVATDDANPYGHSRHGEAFDEGPRQAAYRMPGLGDQVHLPVAGLSPEAQAFFDQAVTQQHGFWYYESERSFRQVQKLHPECAMAYWGMCVANIDNAERAAGFICKAVEYSKDIPAREQLWVDAWATYYGVTDKVRKQLQSGDRKRVEEATKKLVEKVKGWGDEKDRGKRRAAKGKREKKLIKDLGTLVFEHPDDLEAKAFLAIQNWHAYAWGGGVEIVSHTAVDALLREVLGEKPLHPCHHYRIHLWDREDARRSLDSASKIGFSAPAIAHQWHMAGHIYAKLDRHAEAAWQQEASGRADHAHMHRDRVMPFDIHNYGHNQEWLCRSLSLVGRWQEALAIAKNLAELPRHPKLNMPGSRGDIAYYGRQRLLSVCEDHRLWEQAVDICRAGYFEAEADVHGEASRLGLLGRALFQLGRRDEAERVVADAEKLLERARRERAAGIDEAEQAAIDADKKRSEVDDALAEASREGTDAVRRVRDLLKELEAERLLADGDGKAAVELLEDVNRFPKTLLADAKLAAGDAVGAIELLEKEVESRPARAPTLRRLLAALEAAQANGEQAQGDAQNGDAKKGGPKKGEPKRVRPEKRAERIAEVKAALAAIPSSMAEFGDDFGERPPLADLGPFRWQPQPARPLDLPVAGEGGQRFRLADAGGPTLVVFYLGFGCLHCVEQLQAIAPQAEAFADLGVRIVAVGTDTAPKAGKSLASLGEDAFPFPLVADPELGAFKEWRCYDDFEAMPLHGLFLVDGDGRVRWSDISYEPFVEIEWLLDESRRLLALPTVAGSR